MHVPGVAAAKGKAARSEVPCQPGPGHPSRSTCASPMHSPRIYSLHLPPQGPLRPTRTAHGIQPPSCLPISRALSDTGRTHLGPWPCSVDRLLSSKAGLALGKQRAVPGRGQGRAGACMGICPFLRVNMALSRRMGCGGCTEVAGGSAHSRPTSPLKEHILRPHVPPWSHPHPHLHNNTVTR